MGRVLSVPPSMIVYFQVRKLWSDTGFKVVSMETAKNI